MQAKAVAVTQSAVKLRAQRKVLTAQAARIGAGRERQRPAYRQRVSELPWLVLEVLLGNEVLGKIPAFEVAAQDQLQLHFAFFLAAVIPLQEILYTVMPDYFQQRLVRAVDVLKLDVQHRIDPVLFEKRAESVLQAEAGKQAALIGRGLRIQIDL